MEKKITLAFMALTLITGFTVAQSVDIEQYEEEVMEAEACNSENVNNTTVMYTTSDTELTVQGHYCANTAGYEVVDESINVEDTEVNIDIEIEETSDAAAQVITPVAFQVSQDLEEEGNYNVTTTVNLDSEEIHEETENMLIGDEAEDENDEEEQGMISRFFGWFSSLLSF